MKKRILLAVSAAAVLVACVLFAALQKSPEAAFRENLKVVVTETLTLPWEEWPSVVESMDPAAPESYIEALEEYLTEKFQERVTESGIRALSKEGISISVWNGGGKAPVDVVSFEAEGELSKDGVLPFSVTLQTDGREYVIQGKAQIAKDSGGKLGFCTFESRGFLEFIDEAMGN